MQETHRPLRTIGTIGLTMSGITCIIGSGWLFGAFHAAKLAGPASIVAWIIGGLAMLLIALTIVELATLFPHSGGLVRYMHYSHGSLTGFLAAWANWLAIVTVIPAEATASIQYLSSWHWAWCQKLFDLQQGQLTHTGLLGATILVGIYFLINYWTIKLFMRFVVTVTIFKIFVPFFTSFMLFFSAFHRSNFTQVHGFDPHGIAAIFTAVATSGIIFAFNGFQTPTSFAGETKNPSVAIPMALIGSILVTLLLYIILQVVFIGALSPATLAAGWSNLQFSSPFAQLAITLNLNFLVLMLYADAFLSPSVTAIAYMGATTRMLYGMQQNGFMPNAMGRLHPKYLIPRSALWVNMVVSLIFLYLYRGWGNLAAVISVATVISYLAGPVATMGLRRIAPQLKRPVKMKAIPIIAPITFVIISLIFFWSRWPLTGQIILALFTGVIIFCYYQNKRGWEDIGQHLRASYWLICYMLTMALLSYLGSSAFGGINFIHEGWDQLTVAIVALFFYRWGVRSAWVTPALAAMTHMPVDVEEHTESLRAINTFTN